MKLIVSHLTRYEYDQEVSYSPHLLYMRPRDSALLRVNHFHFNISPDAKIIWSRDPLDNLLAWAHFWERSATLSIRTEFEVETLDTNPFDFILKTHAFTAPFEYEPIHKFHLAPYLAPPFDNTQISLRNWLDEHFVDRPKETIPYLIALNSLVHQSLTYNRRDEIGIQPSLTTLALGTGSCRDYAVLFVELCRTLGFAARFVSGYLYVPEPNPESVASNAMHAWAEVYLPGAGWKGLDPTNGTFCDEHFIPVAHGAIAESVNPIQGSYYAPDPVPSKLGHNIIVEQGS
ncbi:MAG: transglutaminase family protein [Opitutaceae bacterium]|jgi:transglutaminase-like putative cysteine protease